MPCRDTCATRTHTDAQQGRTHSEKDDVLGTQIYTDQNSIQQRRKYLNIMWAVKVGNQISITDWLNILWVDIA